MSTMLKSVLLIMLSLFFVSIIINLGAGISIPFVGAQQAASIVNPHASGSVKAGVVSAPISKSATGVQTSHLISSQSANITPTTNNSLGQLKIITHNQNNCRPQSSCSSIASQYPDVFVNTFDSNKYSQISSFPGSEIGRIVNFFQPPSSNQPIQYDVKQNSFFNPANITTHTSSDCEGIIHPSDNKVCVITNSIYSAGNPLGQLKIITHNQNNCRPQSSCSSIASQYPDVFVNTFDSNKYSQISSFPGSEIGRIVNFFVTGTIQPIQYDIRQISFASVIANPSNANITTHTSSDCEGIIHPSDNKVCMVSNVISNGITSQNATTLSVEPTSHPSNITSPTK